MAPRRSPRDSHRNTINVSKTAGIDGTKKISSQRKSEGKWLPKMTRLAGLEMGRRKLAALAMSAHASKCGRGFTSSRRTMVSTAGVSTTAVASLERKAVTPVPAA